jgi:hypothetical protein
MLKQEVPSQVQELLERHQLNDERNERKPGDPNADLAPHWIEPGTAALSQGRHRSLEIELVDGSLHRGAFAVCCFPATRPSDFVRRKKGEKKGQNYFSDSGGGGRKGVRARPVLAQRELVM